MKYCSKCGYAMEDDMRFCQKCGKKADEPLSTNYNNTYLNERDVNESTMSVWKDESQKQSKKSKPRIGFILLSSLCFFGAVVGLFVEINEAQGNETGANNLGISMIAFYAIFGFMFLRLSLSPKKEKNFKGKVLRKKSTFVIICVVSAYAFLVIPAIQTSLAQKEEGDNIINELSDKEIIFYKTFDCNVAQAKNLCAIFDSVGLTLLNNDKVSRREDMDNWDNDGSIAYEIQDVAIINGEQQKAHLYMSENFDVLDIRFLSNYLYEDGMFVQTAQEAYNIFLNSL